MARSRANRRRQAAYSPPSRPKCDGFNCLSVCGPLIRHQSENSTGLSGQRTLISVLPSCLPAFLPSCLPAFLPSCLPAFLRSCRPAFLPSSVPVVLRRIPRLRSPLSPRRSRSRRRQPASPDAHSQQSTRVPAIVPVASGRPAITNFLSNHECHGRSIKRWMCGMPFRIGINRSASSSPVPCGLFSDQ